MPRLCRAAAAAGDDDVDDDDDDDDVGDDAVENPASRPSKSNLSRNRRFLHRPTFEPPKLRGHVTEAHRNSTR